MLAEIEGGRRRERQRMRWLDRINDSVDHMSFTKLWKMVKDREAWCAATHGITKHLVMVYANAVYANEISLIFDGAC